jgi:hypothetical protein
LSGFHWLCKESETSVHAGKNFEFPPESRKVSVNRIRKQTSRAVLKIDDAAEAIPEFSTSAAAG